jgi:hypothetical protein
LAHSLGRFNRVAAVTVVNPHGQVKLIALSARRPEIHPGGFDADSIAWLTDIIVCAPYVSAVTPTFPPCLRPDQDRLLATCYYLLYPAMKCTRTEKVLNG